MGTPRDFPITFPGAETRNLPAVGRFVRVLDAPAGPVFISFEGNEELERTEGQDIDYGKEFKRIRVRSAVAQTVRLCISDQRQDDGATTVNANVNATVAAGSTIVTVPDVVIGAGASAVIWPGGAPNLTVTITNLSTNVATIRIAEAGAPGPARGQPLEPGQSIGVSATAVIHGYNTGAAPQAVAVFAVQQ